MGESDADKCCDLKITDRGERYCAVTGFVVTEDVCLECLWEQEEDE
jgi:hypothetical protein